jgi:hypothetical protein
MLYRAPRFKECLQHQGHKEDPGVTLGTCVMFSEGTQVYLVLGMEPRASRMPPVHKD